METFASKTICPWNRNEIDSLKCWFSSLSLKWNAFYSFRERQNETNRWENLPFHYFLLNKLQKYLLVADAMPHTRYSQLFINNSSLFTRFRLVSFYERCQRHDRNRIRFSFYAQFQWHSLRVLQLWATNCRRVDYKLLWRNESEEKWLLVFCSVRQRFNRSVEHRLIFN